MTIDELKSNLKKISPQLKLDVDLNEPMGVWYESDDSSEDDLELFRIDENDFYFEPIINEIYEANSLIGSDTVKEVGDLLFKYFEPELSKESQKISKDSQKKPLRIVDKDQFKRYQVKFFNERFCYYEFHKDLDDVINDFCLKHDVIKIEFFQDEKERLNAVVTYVIYKIESDPLIDECN